MVSFPTTIEQSQQKSLPLILKEIYPKWFYLSLLFLFIIGAANFILFHDFERAVARVLIVFFFLLSTVLSFVIFAFVTNPFRKAHTAVQVISTPAVGAIASTVILVSIAIAGFISQLIGIFLAPNYLISFILYDIWSYIYTGLAFLSLAFIYYRINKQSLLAFISTILLILAILSVFGYILYLRSQEEGAASLENRSWRVTADNRFIDTGAGYTYTLFPRNGTWSKATGDMPASENEFGFSALIYSYKEEQGKYFVYDNCNLGYVPYDMADLQPKETIASNGLSWKLYKSTKPDDRYKYSRAISTYQNYLIEIGFSYRTDMTPWNIFLPTQARHFFIQTVRSFKLVPPITPLKSYGEATCTNHVTN